MLNSQSWKLELVQTDPGYGQPHVRPFPSLALREPMPVHLALIEHGVITRPTSSPTAEAGCLWVAESTWAYSTEFVTPEITEPVLLHIPAMEGVMEVQVQGESIGFHDNAFLPARFLLNLPANAQISLRLVFHNAIEEGQRRRKAYFEAEELPWNTSFFDERAFLRRPDYNYGWDWGPRIIGVGLMSEPTLTPLSQVQPELNAAIEPLGDRQYRVLIKLESVHNQTYQLQYDPPSSVESFELRQTEGNAWELDIVGGEWNPRGFGEQTLHTVNLENLTECSLTFGLRTVELLQEPDSWGTSFEFRINGKRIWCRGANWIPDDILDPRVNEASLSSKLRSLANANFNMLRVWGGGTYESESFYSLCDELGIMVWQDFPFACSYYPDDAAAKETLRNEANAQISRIRKHPSLALWCGNNENEVMYVQKWSQNGPIPPRYYGESLYYDVLPSCVKALDPGTPYIPGSPMGSPPDKVDPNGDFYGDQHYWEVWHGQGDWVHYANSNARFSSEFGFASAAPCLRFPDSKNPWESDTWHRFDRTGKPRTRIQELVELHYPEATDIPHWQLITQLNQRDAMRSALEHYRTSEFCRGALIWQANDCWPAFSWSLMDFHGDGKAALFEMRRAFADVLLAVKYDQDSRSYHVTAVNHGSQSQTITVRSRLIDATANEEVKVVVESVKLDADAKVAVHRLELPGPQQYVLITEVEGMPFSKTWRLSCEPKEFVAPPSQVTIEFKTRQIKVQGLLWEAVPVASRGNIVSFEPLCAWNEVVPFPSSWSDVISGLLGPSGRIACIVQP